MGKAVQRKARMMRGQHYQPVLCGGFLLYLVQHEQGNLMSKRHYRYGKCTGHKDDGSPCQQAAMRNGKCYHHGGATPEGPDSANWVHGIYSEALKRAKRSGLMAAYERVLNDDELLSLTDEIALTKARIFELLQNEGEAPDYQVLLKYYKAARDAYQMQHEDRFIPAFNSLGDAIIAGAAEIERRQEIRDESDTLRKLNVAEQQRRVKQHQYVEGEIVVTILARLGVIISTAHSIEQLQQEALDFIQELIGPHTRAHWISQPDTADIIDG